MAPATMRAQQVFDAEAVVQAFVGNKLQQSLELPRSLTAWQRKSVKAEVDKHADLRCDSFGFGADRQMHLFKRTEAAGSSALPSDSTGSAGLKVKNTFTDDWAAAGPSGAEPAAYRSTPASLVSPSSRLNGLVNATLPSIAEATLTYAGDCSEESTCASEASMVPSPCCTGSRSPETAARGLRDVPSTEGLVVRNTFIHFEAPSADERTVQSMPHGMFSQLLLAERAAKVAEAAEPASADINKASPTGGAPVDILERPASIDVGALVRVQGLTKAPAFNGRVGTVEGFDAEAGRFSIRLGGETGQPGGPLAKVKPENLELVTPAQRRRPVVTSLDLEEDASHSDSFSSSIPCTPMWDDERVVKAPLTLPLTSLV
eukprot:TRINITY_DN24797_c0_g1_i2.p1 TRINITY_DN24797_c0_g1~~TRINITY_DN24797_c0_g1_i2.p1  ORF type:complete len:374 (-),score=86.24 TRINITY_DN24797_c0_g1_i2:42-1163(-)